MSGGVDSSVAAALLKEQGYDMVGITLNLLSESGREKFVDGIESAQVVARQLSIPHYILDVQKEFEEKVVTVFCEEYLAGRTPNPCVVCNRHIKFGVLLMEARRRGANFIATGHYARVTFDEDTGRYLLKKGQDSRKDQSYFLFALTQDQLRSITFPLGELTKSVVRMRAKEMGLPVYDRRGSQEICFLSDNDYGMFIRCRYPESEQPGPIVSTDGEVLGRHAGIHSFTIGQRKGLNIARGYPLYVMRLEKETNTVVVGKKEETLKKELTASKVNWIAFDTLTTPLFARARIRYQHQEQPARIYPLSEDRVRVIFYEPQAAITPGQAVVFFQDDVVLGGGWIEG